MYNELSDNRDIGLNQIIVLRFQLNLNVLLITNALKSNELQ